MTTQEKLLISNLKHIRQYINSYNEGYSSNPLLNSGVDSGVAKLNTINQIFKDIDSGLQNVKKEDFLSHPEHFTKLPKLRKKIFDYDKEIEGINNLMARSPEFNATSPFLN